MKLGKIEKRVMSNPRHAKRVTERAKKLLRFTSLEGKQDFLEVGCGSGAVSKYIAQNHGSNVTGIDLDPGLIELAREGIGDIPNAHFFVADATHLPFGDNEFDVVLSFGVMHHIPNWLDALEEIARVLKPGGYFVYWDLVYPRLVAKAAKSFKHNYGVTTIHDLNLFIAENNFSVVHASLSKSFIWSNCEVVYQKN